MDIDQTSEHTRTFYPKSPALHPLLPLEDAREEADEREKAKFRALLKASVASTAAGTADQAPDEEWRFWLCAYSGVLSSGTLFVGSLSVALAPGQDPDTKTKWEERVRAHHHPDLLASVVILSATEIDQTAEHMRSFYALCSNTNNTRALPPLDVARKQARKREKARFRALLREVIADGSLDQ